MEHEILHRPSYALLKVNLSAGESVIAESGAMVSMSDTIEMKTSSKGGVFGAIKRKLLTSESFFMNTFTARQAGQITFAPPLPGDIDSFELNNNIIYVQSGSFLASFGDIEMDTKFGGAKTFFSREGLFLVKLSGSGTVFISSYGAIEGKELAAGEKYIVDTGHMVAFTSGISYSVRFAGGVKSTLLGGEGLVCELTGPGKIFIQTRSIDSFLSWLLPKIPQKRD